MYTETATVLGYHIQYRRINQFSNTQRSVKRLVTMNCDEPLSPTNSHPFLFYDADVLSEAKCSLCLVAAFCVHLVECVEGV